MPLRWSLCGDSHSPSLTPLGQQLSGGLAVEEVVHRVTEREVAEVNRNVAQSSLPLALLATLCGHPRKRRRNRRYMKRNRKEGVSIANTSLKIFKKVSTKRTQVSTHTGMVVHRLNTGKVEYNSK